jgi:hypothetical protein
MTAPDDWHRKLARELAEDTPHAPFAEDAAALEIEFGRARSAITYVLELARAHRIPATGSVTGDDVWIKLGEARVRFTLNRREAHVVIAISPQDEWHAAWNTEKRTLVDTQGAALDLGGKAREAIDGLVAEWRKMPSRPRVPVSEAKNRDDEPTKG